MERFTLEILPDGPTVLVTFLADWRLNPDYDPFALAAANAMSSLNQPAFLLIDFHLLQIGVEDVILGASRAARESGAVLKHPNFREFVVVRASTLIEVAARGLQSDMFGNVPVAIFPTLEEGLAYIKNKV
jgi:hypothetical protein